MFLEITNHHRLILSNTKDHECAVIKILRVHLIWSAIVVELLTFFEKTVRTVVRCCRRLPGRRRRFVVVIVGSSRMFLTFNKRCFIFYIIFDEHKSAQNSRSSSIDGKNNIKFDRNLCIIVFCISLPQLFFPQFFRTGRMKTKWEIQVLTRSPFFSYSISFACS